MTPTTTCLFSVLCIARSVGEKKQNAEAQNPHCTISCLLHHLDAVCGEILLMDSDGEQFWSDHFGSDSQAIDFDRFCSAFEKHHSTVLSQALPTDFAIALRYVVIPDSAGSNDAHQIRKEDFNLFLKRFGPLRMSFRKTSECFFCQRQQQYGPSTMMVPWFHGTLSRQRAEELCQKDGTNGAFLVRFSEREPDKFTLTYLKVEGSGATKQFKMRNCLIYNVKEDGFCLTFPPTPKAPLFSSVGDFVRKNQAKLKVACKSSLSQSYQQAHGEWGRKRMPSPAQQSQAVDASNYSHFVAEDAGSSDMYGAFGGAAAGAPAMDRSSSNSSSSSRNRDDSASNYGGFVASRSPVGSPSNSAGAAEYGQFSSGTKPPLSPQHQQHQQHQQPQQHQQHQQHQQQQPIDLYGHFVSPPSPSAPHASHREPDDGSSNYGGFVPPPADSASSYGGFVAPASSAVAEQPVYDDPYSVHISDSSAEVQPAVPVGGTDYGQFNPSQVQRVASGGGGGDVAGAAGSDYGHFDPAALDAETKQKDAEQQDAEAREAQAQAFLEQGINLFKEHRHRDAATAFQQAADLARETSPLMQARALGNLGAVYSAMGEHAEAVEFYIPCLQLAKEVNDSKRQKTIINNLVLCCREAGQYQRALHYCDLQLGFATPKSRQHATITARITELEQKLQDASFN
jgi:hypothetical protein